MADYRPTRRQREGRAFQSLVAAGASGVAAIVLLFVSGFGLFLLFAILAGFFGFMFKRSVS
ncbi:MAG: hypothetical protein QOF76_2367 [Solirubrobacteraceae bacterium]|jgi:hypothetical protein|nr:hypothetical protein [Solirubrobacteraceae bacterium]